MGGVDLDDPAAAKRQVEEAIDSPYLCAAVFESGCTENPRYADDPEFTPLFGACEDARLPSLRHRPTDPAQVVAALPGGWHGPGDRGGCSSYARDRTGGEITA